MPTGTEEELKRARSAWNYADVIALVTANLPGRTFNGDRSAWLRGIYALTQKHPQFFRGVHFIRREPYTPYSRQVDEVLKMLGKWEYRSDFNPRYRRIELSDDGKQELKESLERRLSDHLPEIREMSDILEGYVSLTKEDQAHGRKAREPKS